MPAYQRQHPDFTRHLCASLDFASFVIALSQARRGDRRARAALFDAVRQLSNKLHVRSARSHDTTPLVIAARRDAYSAIDRAISEFTGWDVSEFAAFVAKHVWNAAQKRYSSWPIRN
ncbi:MAG: hypothetical protein AAF961_05440 [Planctomycetota bacterium]